MIFHTLHFWESKFIVCNSVTAQTCCSILAFKCPVTRAYVWAALPPLVGALRLKATGNPNPQ